MDDYNHSAPKNRKDAKKTLKDLLPRARAEARRASSLSSFPISKRGVPIVASANQWLRESNIRGVHIYQYPNGLWSADLELKNTPPGVPAIMGTPDTNLHTSQNDAIDGAILMLVAAVVVEMQAKAATGKNFGGTSYH